MGGVRGETVYPFAQDGAWLQMWAFDTCIAASHGGMMLLVNETACGSDNAADQVQLLYYEGDRSCRTAPTVVPLTLGSCVAYPLGSVKLTAQLSTDDLCTATDYMVKLKQGGVNLHTWSQPNCSGELLLSEQPMATVKECANEPECDGCCVRYDTGVCWPDRLHSHRFTRSACTRDGNTWRFALTTNWYNDSKCSGAKGGTIFAGQVIELGVCNKHDGDAYKLAFAAPMTVDVMCAFVDMALRNKLNAEVVSWSELNGAAGAVPQVLFLALLVAAVLL